MLFSTSKSHRPSLADGSDSALRSSILARWRCTRRRSSPVAKLEPTSFSIRCRLASQPSRRGCDDISAMKPQTRSCSDKPADQRRAHVEVGQACGVDGVLAARLERVADLGEAQVFEPAGQQRQAFDRVALQHLRIERRQQAGGARHALDVLALGVEQRDADRVDAGRLAQRVEVALDAVVARFAGERDEVDRDLGDEDVETDGGTTATAEDELGGQEVVRFLFFATDRRGLRRHRAIRSPWARPGRASGKAPHKTRSTREPDSDIKGAKLKLRR